MSVLSSALHAEPLISDGAAGGLGVEFDLQPLRSPFVPLH